MYHFWRQNPLFRPALAFALGILLYDKIGWSIYWLFPTGLFVAAQLFWRFRSSWKRVNSIIPTLFLLLGSAFHALQPGKLEIPEQKNGYLLEIETELIRKRKTITCEANLLAYDSLNNAVKIKPIRLKLIFDNDSASLHLLPGDRILAFGKMKKIAPPLNPYTFDYAAFMVRHGVYHQLRIEQDNWRIHSQQNSIQRLAIRWRNEALSIFDASIHQQENRAIIKALICGYTQELVPEIREVYVKSGTMHMLAVSGMHVGILLIILGKSVFWLRNALIKNLLLIVLLWLYALITGLSPSVMRAVSMCSLYLVGESLQKEHSSWNAVAFALLVLLVWNTRFLFHAGFQLSFLALTGILLVTRSRSVPATTWKEKAKSWFKAYLAISIAAQLATAPIAIYYFQQFPVYFLIGNLLIVPLAAPLMYGGLVLLLLHQVPFLAPICIWIVDHLLTLCQKLASGIATLPGASAGNLDLDLSLMLALYALLLGLVLRVKIQQSRGLILGMMFLCGWAGMALINQYKEKNQQGLIVYSLYGKSACDLYRGNQLVYRGDSLADNEMHYSVEPFRKAKNLRENISAKEIHYTWGSCTRLNDLRIVRFWGKGDWQLPASPVPTLLILEKDAECRLAPLLDSVIFCNIVLAGNLSWKSRKYWQNCTKELKLPVHDVQVDGAYQKELWNHSFGMK